MINNSTNINKMNKYLLPQIIENKKRLIYGVENSGPGMEEEQTCVGF
jgi:hypothetical protein